MLYTPILPEAASGTLEPRHVVVPLRMMCRHARPRPRRAVTQVDDGSTAGRRSRPRRAASRSSTSGSCRARRRSPHAPDPGPRRARARLQGPRGRDRPAKPRPAPARARGSGSRSAEDAKRHLTLRLRRRRLRGSRGARRALRPRPRHAPLLPAACKDVRAALGARGRGAQDPPRDPHAARRLCGEPALEARRRHPCFDHTGVRGGARRDALGREPIDTETLVWTAGVRANPMVSGRSGCPLDESGRVKVGPHAPASRASENVWALGDCARVPNEATPGRFDPPTCQHALRQARRLAKNLGGEPAPYRYRMLGQVATLGRHKGIADVLGLRCAASSAGSSRARTTSTSSRSSRGSFASSPTGRSGSSSDATSPSSHARPPDHAPR